MNRAFAPLGLAGIPYKQISIMAIVRRKLTSRLRYRRQHRLQPHTARLVPQPSRSVNCIALRGYRIDRVLVMLNHVQGRCHVPAMLPQSGRSAQEIWLAINTLHLHRRHGAEVPSHARRADPQGRPRRAEQVRTDNPRRHHLRTEGSGRKLRSVRTLRPALRDQKSRYRRQPNIQRMEQGLPDQAVTAAAIHRLVHHAFILEINGDSYRRRAAASRQSAKVDAQTTTSSDNIKEDGKVVSHDVLDPGCATRIKREVILKVENVSTGSRFLRYHTIQFGTSLSRFS